LELLHLAEISSPPSRAFEHKYYIRSREQFSNFEDFRILMRTNSGPRWPYWSANLEIAEQTLSHDLSGNSSNAEKPRSGISESSRRLKFPCF
jgi:hypothetical protein